MIPQRTLDSFKRNARTSGYLRDRLPVLTQIKSAGTVRRFFYDRGILRNYFVCPIHPSRSPFRNRKLLAGGGKINHPFFTALIAAVKGQREKTWGRHGDVSLVMSIDLIKATPSPFPAPAPSQLADTLPIFF